MKTAACIYAGALSPEALSPLAGGKSAYERCLDLAAGLPGLQKARILEGPLGLPQGPFPASRRGQWSRQGLLEEMESLGEGMDSVFFLWADEPCVDPDLAARMLKDFQSYRADYCFADGYPDGIALEILAPRIVPPLRKLAASLPAEPGRDWLFSTIQKDINAFDIETSISPRDLRDLRLRLACDSKRNRLLVERLMEAGLKDEASALDIIPRRLDLLRTLPAFIQVQVTGGCPQACTLCPYPAFGGDILGRRDYMPRERFAALMDQVRDFCGDAVIDISLWGEPSLHPDIDGLVDEVLSRPGLSLIIETSGLGWNREKVGAIAKRLSGDSSSRLDWVVSLDAESEGLYGRLRGRGFEEARSFAEFLIGLFPGACHVQLVRSHDNEAELEAFWRGWKKKTEGVIIQKYSSFAGFLPQRKVTDLSPLVRRPCWHLKRDMAVLLDGSVPLCRDCVDRPIILGNVFEGGEGLAAAFRAGDAFHRAHIDACNGKEDAYPAVCVACDEYYTYNA